MDIFPALASLLLASAPPSPVDTDREGVLVTTDRCPTASETINGFADADGCPDELPADLRSVPGPVPGLRFILADKQALLVGTPGRLEHVRHVLARYPALRIQVVARERNSDLARQKAEEVRQQLVAYRDNRPEISIHGTRSSATPSIELTIAAGPDSDADGFADDFDVCPTAAGDGVSPCPGPDPDADDLAAPRDRCPTVPETHNGYQDADGCPDAWPADLTQLHGILAGVTFEPDRAPLLPRSYPVLDRLAILLTRHPDVRLEISNHRDSGGSSVYYRSSSERAESVKQYLVERGIATHRLETRNAGADEPLDTNKAAAGRRRNNRIELTILVERPSP